LNCATKSPKKIKNEKSNVSNFGKILSIAVWLIDFCKRQIFANLTSLFMFSRITSYFDLITMSRSFISLALCLCALFALAFGQVDAKKASVAVTNQVYFDITIDGEAAGRITMNLSVCDWNLHNQIVFKSDYNQQQFEA
jgi:hypothetical protein